MLAFSGFALVPIGTHRPYRPKRPRCRPCCLSPSSFAPRQIDSHKTVWNSNLSSYLCSWKALRPLRKGDPYIEHFSLTGGCSTFFKVGCVLPEVTVLTTNPMVSCKHIISNNAFPLWLNSQPNCPSTSVLISSPSGKQPGSSQRS